MKNLIAKYRLPETTTPEELGCRWSKTLTFGNKILLAGYWYSWKEPCYYGAVYEFTTADHSCEGQIKLTAVSEQRFEDDGHAIAWAIEAAQH